MVPTPMGLSMLAAFEELDAQYLGYRLQTLGQFNQGSRIQSFRCRALSPLTGICIPHNSWATVWELPDTGLSISVLGMSICQV